jgi:hypothetical protein
MPRGRRGCRLENSFNGVGLPAWGGEAEAEKGKAPTVSQPETLRRRSKPFREAV